MQLISKPIQPQSAELGGELHSATHALINENDCLFFPFGSQRRAVPLLRHADSHDDMLEDTCFRIHLCCHVSLVVMKLVWHLRRRCKPTVLENVCELKEKKKHYNKEIFWPRGWSVSEKQILPRSFHMKRKAEGLCLRAVNSWAALISWSSKWKLISHSFDNSFIASVIYQPRTAKHSPDATFSIWGFVMILFPIIVNWACHHFNS